MRSIAIAWAIFCGLALARTYPLISKMSDHIPYGLGDPLLNTWILSWDFHALTTDPWNLFNANAFYPLQHALALSEHMLGAIPLFAPTYLLTGNPILSYNVVLLVSFPLCGLSMFCLVHYWTRNFWASILAGSFFAFAPARLSQLGHLQLLNFYWAPLALLFLERFLRNQRWRDLGGLAICYWLQVLCSVYLAWFATIMIIIYVTYYALLIDRRVVNRQMLLKWVMISILSFILLIPLYLPYHEIKQQWGLSRSVQECIFYSADFLVGYLNVLPIMNDLYLATFKFAAERNYLGENTLFQGFILPILVILTYIYRQSLTCKFHLRYMWNIYSTILICAFILSLGPYLIVLGANTNIPMPYLLLYHILPGFQSMRVPSRFSLVLMLAASVLAALGFLQAWNFFKIWRWCRVLPTPAGQAILACFVLGLFFFELGLKPIPLDRIETGHRIPEVYRWLGAEKPGPILELPTSLEGDFRSMYFSTYHWLPVVNGRSGFTPPTYLPIALEAEALPSRSATEFLAAIGIHVLVVHTDRLDSQRAVRWQEAELAESGLKKMAVFGPDVVYKLPEVERTQWLDIEFAVPHRLPAAASLRSGFLAKGTDRRAWKPPFPMGPTPVVVKWEELQTGKALFYRETVQFPLAIRAREYDAIGFLLRTPANQGRYTLQLSLPLLGIETPPQFVEMTAESWPTSLTAPQLLSAAYSLDAAAPRAVASIPLGVAVRAENTGKAVWLAAAEGDRGAVRLGWRWFKADQEIHGMGGRRPIHYDIFPGQSYVFHAHVDTPVQPGDYTLELELVSELVSWFSSEGTAPLKVPVRVISPR